jgi:hypothetical protein
MVCSIHRVVHHRHERQPRTEGSCNRIAAVSGIYILEVSAAEATSESQGDEVIPTVEHNGKRHIVGRHFPTDSGSYFVEFLCESEKNDMDICRAIENLVSLNEYHDGTGCPDCLRDFVKRGG